MGQVTGSGEKPQAAVQKRLKTENRPVKRTILGRF